MRHSLKDISCGVTRTEVLRKQERTEAESRLWTTPSVLQYIGGDGSLYVHQNSMHTHTHTLRLQPCQAAKGLTFTSPFWFGWWSFSCDKARKSDACVENQKWAVPLAHHVSHFLLAALEEVGCHAAWMQKHLCLTGEGGARGMCERHGDSDTASFDNVSRFHLFREWDNYSSCTDLSLDCSNRLVKCKPATP